MRHKYVVRREGRECIYCWLFKEWDEFSPDKSRKTQGTRSQCKRCSVVMAWRWNQANREQIREADRRRRAGKEIVPRHCPCGRLATSRKGVPRCEECTRAADRAAWLRLSCKRYGITVEEYEAAFKAQNGRCAVNPDHLLPTDRRPDIDHCHETGVFRGITCHGCNMMLGGAKDDPETLELGAAYLRNPRQLRMTG